MKQETYISNTNKVNVQCSTFDFIGSPSLNEFSHAFETFAIETFRKDVSPLFLCFNFDNVDSTIADMSPEEVPFDLKIFGAVCDALVCCQKKSTVVVFKDLALDRCDEGVGERKTSHNFNKH